MIQKLTLGVSILALIAASFALLKSTDTVTHPAGEAESPRQRAARDSGEVQPRIAFIKGDSLNLGYKFISDKQDELISSSRQAESKLQRSLQKAEKEYEDLMRYAQSGNASEDEMQIAQQRIMELQYDLQRMEQEEQQRLARQEQVMQNEIVTRLNAFLIKYAEEEDIDLILNWGISGEGVLYGSEPFDITADVVRKLNEAYAIELAQKKSKP